MTAILIGIFIPFIGTILGSAIVFFFNKSLPYKLNKAILGFASGVMISASIWSLIDPSLQMSSSMGIWQFIPAAIGFLTGIAFLLLLDKLIPHIHSSGSEEGKKSRAKKTTKMLFAVTLHNIPEGMAVGVVLAGAYYGDVPMSVAGALALAIGIAIQNFPEGAIVALPLYEEGLSKPKSFFLGCFSGIVEPIASALTILFVTLVEAILPYILAFAAGAMMYVVVEELIPDSQSEPHTNISTISFAIGFILMMILDVAFG